MQTKLTEKQVENLRLARNGISAGIPWLSIGEAKDFWNRAVECLDKKVKHGTSDGKPYIEPEPPIPDGYRKANADEWRRKDVKLWNSTSDTWVLRPLQGCSFDPPDWGTRYIVPIAPPLTDEDARERPWVMVRNSDAEKFRGPYRLGMVNQAGWKYTVFTKNDKRDSFFQARRATPEEIEAAK